MTVEYYIDTSVLGGYFDIEFEQATRRFWSSLDQGEWRAILSTLTIEEVARAPGPVQKLLEDLRPECYSIFGVTTEAKTLANRYLEESILAPPDEADALHVAIATLSPAKAIISWNFKHLVNLRRIEGFNRVNLKMGHRAIDIRSPLEVIES